MVKNTIETEYMVRQNVSKTIDYVRLYPQQYQKLYYHVVVPPVQVITPIPFKARRHSPFHVDQKRRKPISR